MSKFRKKPVVIDAEQFNPEVRPYPDGVLVGLRSPTGFFIRTLEGHHEVTPGDWIITGVRGEKYPCKPDIFEMTYEPVDVVHG
jgi:hypothetical protein